MMKTKHLLGHIDKAIRVTKGMLEDLEGLYREVSKPKVNKPKLPPDPPPQPVQDRRHCSNRYALGQTVKYVGGDHALFNHLGVITALSYYEDDRKWVYAIDFGNCGLFTVDEDFLCVFESKLVKTKTKEEPVPDRKVNTRYRVGDIVEYRGDCESLHGKDCQITGLKYIARFYTYAYSISLVFRSNDQAEVNELFGCLEQFLLPSTRTNTRTKEEIEASQQHAISP